MASQPGLVSLPAATKPAAGRTSASTNAQHRQRQGAVGRTSVAATRRTPPCGQRTRRSAPDPAAATAPRRGRRQGPGALDAAPGPWSVASSRQTSVLLRGHRGRVRPAWRSGRGSRGPRSPWRATPCGGRRWSSWPGCRWCLRRDRLGARVRGLDGLLGGRLGASWRRPRPWSSALSATLVAWAAVFCATEVTLLDASTTTSAVSSRTSSRVSSTVSTARSARRTTRRKPGW